MPPSASSKRPRLAAIAPVKAPRAWPNSSDSSSDSDSAVQLTGTNGRCARVEREWMARATSSFPVPDSPITSTVALDGATARDQLVHLEHARAFALDLGQPRLGRAPARRAFLRRQPLALERAADREAQLLDVERLRDIVVGAFADRLHRARDVAERGDQDDRRLGGLLRERAQHREAVRAIHAHVGHDQVIHAGGGARDRHRAVVDRVDLEALAAQDLLQENPAPPRRPRPPKSGSCATLLRPAAAPRCPRVRPAAAAVP